MITSFVIIDRKHEVCYCVAAAAAAAALKLCETIDLTSMNHNTIDLVSDHC